MPIQLTKCVYFVPVVTIFAYGQTSSGKTFTIRGEEGQEGLISLAINDICSAINEVNTVVWEKFAVKKFSSAAC